MALLFWGVEQDMIAIFSYRSSVVEEACGKYILLFEQIFIEHQLVAILMLDFTEKVKTRHHPTKV